MVHRVCKRQNIGIPCPCLSPSPRSWGRPKPVRIRHVIPPPWAYRRVSTDLILGAPALPGGVATGHFVPAPTPSPPPLARRWVSTDLILGAPAPSPAPSPAHHDIVRGISWPCQLIEAQVRELPFDCFMRRSAGGGAAAPRVRRHGSLSPRHSAVTTNSGPSVGVHGPHPGSAGALAGPSRHIARLLMALPID